ncbi:hypothetical protein MYX82_04325 [Acidobacteria bacterium AH-259-D05]|nr:hypothetical protein [Acidobacteria bacterium AH-259-D05]
MSDTDLLDLQLQEAKLSVFRLESLPIYRVNGDWQLYERFLAGELAVKDDPNDSYYAALDRLKNDGVPVRRVRVVDFPVSNYLRYEIEWYRISERHGEVVYFIERAVFVDAIQGCILPEDFWAFDDCIVLIYHYDREGRWLGEEQVKDPDVVKRYIDVEKRLLEASLLVEAFMQRYPRDFIGL